MGHCRACEHRWRGGRICGHTHINENTHVKKETGRHTWKHQHMYAHKQNQWSLSWCSPELPNALPRYKHTHTHTCIHLRAICSWRYCLQKGFTADTLRQAEREGQEKGRNCRDRVNQEIRKGGKEEGRKKGGKRQEVTDRDVEGKNVAPNYGT